MITQNRNCPQTETKGCTKPTLCSTTLTTIKKKKEKIKEKIVEIKARQDEAVLSALKEYAELKKERGTGG